jgi:DNA polymerase III epsilon subunit-like protein
MKYFMLDIETMGTDPVNDDVIQIALLELVKDKSGYYQAGRYLDKLLCTEQTPKNAWIATNHKELLRRVGTGQTPAPGLVRSYLREFFNQCGATEPARLMGMNLAMLDIPFMVTKRYLTRAQTDADNKLVGDFHYRVYELRGVVDAALDVFNVDEKLLYKLAAEASPTKYLPKDRTSHDALYDCYKQLNTLNGILALHRSGLSLNKAV